MIAALCLLLACSQAFAQAQETAKVVQTKIHVVQKGQISVDIAKKYGLDLPQLAKLNPGRNLAKLQIGDKLVVGIVPVEVPKPQASEKKAPQPAPTTVNTPPRQDKIALIREHEEKGTVQEKREPSAVGTVFMTIIKLVVVLALAYVTILALKLLSDKRDASPRIYRDLKVVDTVKLSNTNSIHLVEIGGKRLLLGCSSGQVNLLTEFAQEEMQEEPAPVQNGKFADYLARFSGKNSSSTPAQRIAGLLRDCASYLQERKRGFAKTGKTTGDNNEP